MQQSLNQFYSLETQNTILPQKIEESSEQFISSPKNQFGDASACASAKFLLKQEPSLSCSQEIDGPDMSDFSFQSGQDLSQNIGYSSLVSNNQYIANSFAQLQQQHFQEQQCDEAYYQSLIDQFYQQKQQQELLLHQKTELNSNINQDNQMPIIIENEGEDEDIFFTNESQNAIEQVNSVFSHEIKQEPISSSCEPCCIQQQQQKQQQQEKQCTDQLNINNDDDDSSNTFEEFQQKFEELKQQLNRLQQKKQLKQNNQKKQLEQKIETQPQPQPKPRVSKLQQLSKDSGIKLNTSHVPNNLLNLLTKYLCPLYYSKIKCQVNPNKHYKTHPQFLKSCKCKCMRCEELRIILHVKYSKKKNITLLKKLVNFSKRLMILIEDFLLNHVSINLLEKKNTYRSNQSFISMYSTLQSFLSGIRDTENFYRIV